MSLRSQGGQAMVEMAVGVGIFLLAALGSVQLGLSALALEGIQSAALVGARAASASLVVGDPLLRLQQGQEAALTALATTRLGLTTLDACSGSQRGGCGIGATCQLYRGGSAVAGTERPCLDVNSESGYGPVRQDLDGPQNPACGRGRCFGVSEAMSACRNAGAPGRLRVCAAYTSWPPRAVDIWISGSLRTLLPWISRAGPDLEPVSSQLRLQVEALS